MPYLIVAAVYAAPFVLVGLLMRRLGATMLAHVLFAIAVALLVVGLLQSEELWGPSLQAAKAGIESAVRSLFEHLLEKAIETFGSALSGVASLV